MIFDPKEIEYSLISYEEIRIEDIQKVHNNSMLIWVTGSAFYLTNEPSIYQCVLEYKGYKKYIQGEKSSVSANGIMLEGLKAAITRVTKPVNVCVATATSLGFQKAFKGSGVNADSILDIFQMLKEKGCTLTECRYLNGAYAIKKYIKEVEKQVNGF